MATQTLKTRDRDFQLLYSGNVLDISCPGMTCFVIVGVEQEDLRTALRGLLDQLKPQESAFQSAMREFLEHIGICNRCAAAKGGSGYCATA